MREKHKLRVSENRVLRRIFGPKSHEVTGEWRKLIHELNDLYSSPNIVQVIKSRRRRWAEHAAYGERRGVHRVLVGKPEGKRPLGRPRCRWEDNIRMDLQEVGCGRTDLIKLTQDRERWRALVNAVMNLRILYNVGNLLTFILRRSRTGTVWFYTSTSNKRAARPKLYTKSLTRDLKLMYSRLTLVRISINL